MNSEAQQKVTARHVAAGSSPGRRPEPGPC